jgi:amino acid adenylation domain-containing protein
MTEIANSTSEGLIALTPSYQKRNADAPLIRFLPVGPLETQDKGAAERSISNEELRSFEHGAQLLGTTLENLLLAAFACLLTRLTRQGVLAIAVGSADLAIFQLEEDAAFLDVVNQCCRLVDREEDGSSGWDHGVHYEFLTDSSSLSFNDCGLRLLVRDHGLYVELASPSGLWPKVTLRNWLSHLLAIAASGCLAPQTPVSHLQLWDESDARRFYANLNQTSMDFPGETSVVGRFESQANRRPDAPAVISTGLRYSYRELDERSSELAQRLAAAGAGPNRAVAVCMERSADLLLALLAVLKSGGFYVPLDPNNPSGRLQGILEECSPAAVISDAITGPKLERELKLESLQILRVDKSQGAAGEISTGSLRTPVNSAAAATSQTAVAKDLNPKDLAYTIYTSGTTGKPKGVRITHQALLNLICSMWRQPGLGETDRTLAVAPISFDIATMDMFLPICSGGTLVIASRQDAVDPFRLAHLLKEHDITCMQATPVTWRMLVTSGWTGKRNLKMITGGEALPRELANDLLERGGELWNCYGPTETTIYSGVLKIKHEAGIVPVGPPIANTTFYVMDKAGQLLPPGVPGELYIGGLGVSPGYVARPELTAERFVADRFTVDSNTTNGTMFATGDLVRIVNGNELEFFGRLDHQVKLRGFRIELGEIESVLRSHEAITDAVVILREDLPGEPRLVAYVISSDPQLSAEAMRAHAAKSLPEYMLPSLFVTLDRFPLSASGKINRRGLPVPESVPGMIVADRPESAAATDELEAKLLRIFREVLRNDSIGITDSFFRYGGYSLLTVRLFSRIDRELDVRLPISLLFDAPTVQDLARVIRKGISPSVIVPIRPQGKSAPLFLVQSYLLYNAMLEIIEPDRPIYGVREMGDEREPMAMSDRARKFAQEIVAVYPSGPLYLAGWCAAGSLTVEIARQLREGGHEVGLVALFDAERPGFTLPKGVKPWTVRAWKKTVFHARRLQRIPWNEKVTYITDAFGRNWDWAVESYYTANYRTMLWLQRRFGVSLSEAAFNAVYATMSDHTDISVRPYPGKLNLFRAADVPDFAEMDATLGWSVIAEGGVDVNFVPGDHVSMFKKPYNVSLAQRLQRELQASEAAIVQA